MSHYYDENQNSPLREEIISIRFKGQLFDFYSASGLFSKQHLDKATELLIAKADLEGAKTVLDLGSGWGVVAVLLKINNPQKEFYASDISKRAVAYTKKNAEKYKLKIDVRQSDILKSFPEEKFDVILTNPPYVAGRETCKQFIEQSFEHLNKDGSLQLVARHQKGGKFLGEYMKQLFGNMEVIAKQSGFRIYKSLKK